jgi:hypothetical protein
MTAPAPPSLGPLPRAPPAAKMAGCQFDLSNTRPCRSAAALKSGFQTAGRAGFNIGMTFQGGGLDRISSIVSRPSWRPKTFARGMSGGTNDVNQ